MSPISDGAAPVSLPEEHKIRNDLQGLALTLGGPGSGNNVWCLILKWNIIEEVNKVYVLAM